MAIDEAFIGQNDTEHTRVCGTCRVLKPNEDFYRDGKDRKGNIRYRRDCKACYKLTRTSERKMKQKKGR